jgi:hypothetical protein
MQVPVEIKIIIGNMRVVIRRGKSSEKESEVLQQGSLLTFLKPANIKEETSLSDELKHSEILSEDIASSNPTPSCLLDDDPGK